MLCWRCGPIVLFSLKAGKMVKLKRRWSQSSPDGTLFPVCPPFDSGFLQVEPQDQNENLLQSHQSFSPALPPRQCGVTASPQGSDRNFQCQSGIRNLPFPSFPMMPSQTFYPIIEVPTGGGNFGCVDALLTSSEV
jgi:hypothetical protein